MRFRGSTLARKQNSRQQWGTWVNRARRRPQVRDFALRLTQLIEAQVGTKTSQHVAQLAERAMRDAGSANLTDRQVREVLVLLKDVWQYGPALRHWAVRKGILREDA